MAWSLGRILPASTKWTENTSQLFRPHTRQKIVQRALIRDNLIISIFAFPRSELLMKYTEEVGLVLDMGL